MFDRNLKFEDFDHMYSNSDQLPPRADGRVSVDFRIAFDGGLGDLFSSLRDCQPKTFKALSSCVRDYKLLENVVRTRGVYFLGLDLGDKIILGPLFGVTTVRDSINLPEPLWSYYQNTDGLDYPLKNFHSVNCRRLPKMLHSWPLIADYLGRNPTKKKLLKKLESEFGHSNLRIWIETANRELIVSDFGRLDKKLYLLKPEQDFSVELLSDPVGYIDSYVESVLLGSEMDFKL